MTALYEAPTSAADLAERALIGALLWDSGRVRDVRDWLQPDDLNHWKAQAIYETLTGLHRDGRSMPVTELPEVIAAGTYHDSHPGAITAVDVHTYLRATPATPAASAEYPAPLVRSNHVIYARQVLEAAARQAVAAAGSRIQQAAERIREHPDLGPEGIQEALTVAQHRLQELGQRLRHAQGAPGALITAVLAGPVPDTPATETAEIWARPPAPPLTTRAVIEAELEVLGACLTDPTLRAELLGWLTPEDFSRPEHAATWDAFATLTHTDTPIDYVTLAWECERRNPDHDSPGLTPEQLVTMARYIPVRPGPALSTIAHASLIRHTEAARQHIQTISNDRTADALAVVSAASDAYREVGEHARRLTGTATPTPVSRAGAVLQAPAPAPASGTPPRSPSPPPTRPSDEPPQRDHRLGR